MEKDKGKSSLYRRGEHRAAEERNSAYALLVFGVLGILISLGWAFDLLPGTMGIARRFILTSCLSLLSIVLLLLGGFSMRRSQRLLRRVKDEDKRTDEILKWASETIRADELDASLFSEDEEEITEEEARYFFRYNALKRLVSDHFMNLEPEYTEDICEEIYTRLFEKQDKQDGT